MDSMSTVSNYGAAAVWPEMYGGWGVSDIPDDGTPHNGAAATAPGTPPGAALDFSQHGPVLYAWLGLVAVLLFTRLAYEMAQSSPGQS